MSLSITIAAYLGFMVECLWLWDTASEKFARPDKAAIKAPGASRALTAIGITVVIGMTLIGITEWLGNTPLTQKIDEILSFGLLGAAMLFLLAAGVVGGWLLPRVNEYNIISVLAVVALNIVLSNPPFHPVIIGIAITIPAILGIALVFQRTSPTPLAKVVLYALYLIAILVLTILGGAYEMAHQTDFSIPGALVFGATLCFFSLHILFGIRFIVIATAMIFPLNRGYAQPMMEKLYRNDQIQPLPFLVILAVILIFILGNQYFQLFPSESFSYLMVILCTQLLFRTGQTKQIV
jgi:hypothetical protein